MKFQLKLSLTLNLIFTIVFLGHIFSIGHKLLYPDNPSVRIYNRNLSEVDFPLSFKLCLFEQRNASDRYLNIGYSNVYWFFEGKSMFADYFGWNGHAENNETLGSVQGKTKSIIGFFLQILNKVLESHGKQLLYWHSFNQWFHLSNLQVSYVQLQSYIHTYNLKL